MTYSPNLMHTCTRSSMQQNADENSSTYSASLDNKRLNALINTSLVQPLTRNSGFTTRHFIRPRRNFTSIANRVLAPTSTFCRISVRSRGAAST